MYEQLVKELEKHIPATGMQSAQAAGLFSVLINLLNLLRSSRTRDALQAIRDFIDVLLINPNMQENATAMGMD